MATTSGALGPVYEFHGITRPWRLTEANMFALESEGRIDTTSRIPRRVRYLDETSGLAVGDLWADIPRLQSISTERTGYPTQKPRTLLERIIKASSNPGDVVFDPFCGSGTSLVAAEDLQRSWVGIDISKEAAALAVRRIGDRQGMFLDVLARSDIPKRTEGRSTTSRDPLSE